MRADKGIQEVNPQGWLRDKLFDLASEVQDGCVVELGALRGSGTIVLARGARAGHGVQVYTIDDYKYRINWDRGSQRKVNKRHLLINLREANVAANLIHKDAREASKTWTEPIGLLSWDLGDAGRFGDDWDDWSKYIVPGGAAIIKDTPNNIFGTFEIIDEIIKGDDFIKEDYSSGITVLRRSL